MSWDVILIKTETNAESMEEISDPVPVMRKDLQNAICEFLPEAKVFPDEIILSMPDYSVEIMLEDELLDCISLFIRGKNAPLELLGWLCEKLGCRAYDTSTDKFLDFGSSASGFEQWKTYRDRVLEQYDDHKKDDNPDTVNNN
ncbi:MAG: hypothetical protein LBV07_02025 [Syntrophobacterales bacterium]|jgi:hypothetical protein|nr:hypothetical protein [Syntrophobacterales bacterium]